MIRPALALIAPAAALAAALLAPAAGQARNYGVGGQDDSLARAAASEVVVFDVLKVYPRGGTEVATCKVVGRAIRAERGTRYRARQSVRLIVPCAEKGAGSSDSSPRWVDRDALVRSAHGRAFLAKDGALIAYELYDLN